MYQVVYKSQHSDRSASCFCRHSCIKDSVDESLERYTRLFGHLGLGISISAHFSIKFILSVSFMALKNSSMVDWCLGGLMRDGLGGLVSDGFRSLLRDGLVDLVSDGFRGLMRDGLRDLVSDGFGSLMRDGLGVVMRDGLRGFVSR